MTPFTYWTTKNIENALNDPYARGIDGKDFESYYEVTPLPSEARIECLQRLMRTELATRQERVYEKEVSKRDKQWDNAIKNKLNELRDYFGNKKLIKLSKMLGQSLYEYAEFELEQQIKHRSMDEAPF